MQTDIITQDIPQVIGNKLLNLAEKTTGVPDICVSNFDEPQVKFNVTLQLKPFIVEELKILESKIKCVRPPTTPGEPELTPSDILSLSFQEYIKTGLLVYTILANYAEATSWPQATQLLNEFLFDVNQLRVESTNHIITTH